MLREQAVILSLGNAVSHVRSTLCGDNGAPEALRGVFRKKTVAPQQQPLPTSQYLACGLRRIVSEKLQECTCQK